ncbi:hypothetical protein C1Y40_03246 [Mycobacterium talmoniae]|uniref:Uncharacterized protein n=1 Tax=Mycobacterium talmoniae TaxID=1858794 RepID=A0A2S8BIZ0_9MYCO|nr:hypothetical protein C1Y40_03246 [Mycobacterium talmoniae]
MKSEIPAILSTSTSMPMRARSAPASSTTLRARLSRLELRSSTVIVAVIPRRLPASMSLIWCCRSSRSEVKKRCTAVCTASSADPIRTNPTASTLTGTPLLDSAFCSLMLTLNGSSDMTSTRSMPGTRNRAPPRTTLGWPRPVNTATSLGGTLM